MLFGELFDERFRNGAGGIYAYLPIRAVVGAFVASFVAVGAGARAAILWAAAVLLVEIVMLVATRRVARQEAPSRLGIGACVASYAVAVPTWSWAGVLLWNSPDAACQVAGAAFFAGHLLYIQAQHSHSPGAAIPVIPAVLLPAIVPLAMPQFEGPGHVVVCLAMAAVAGHALISMWVSLCKSRDLQQAQFAMAAASQAKSEFLARMSHEIRTPLNGVLGMAQALAADSDIKPEHRRNLEVIRTSGESLLTVLNDILDLSKVEAGRLDLETITFDLGEAIRSAQAAFAPQAKAKGLTFRLTIDPAVAGTYQGDPTRLRQILYNLLSNAVKFTQDGEVSLTVNQVAGALTLVVADTGIGIAEADRAQLFGRFQQVDSSTTRRYGGTGLGLAICRELAELMGGSIEVESMPRAGSRFIVVLPLPRVGDAKGETGSMADARDPGQRESQADLRILAAEDNPINQLVLSTLLAQVGLTPDLVADGAAAVEAWRNGRFDLILMDVQMPVLDGLGAVAAIRAEERKTGRARTPILALTANAMQHQVHEYLTGGFDGHVAKPIDAARLYAAIAEAARADDGLEPAVAV